MVQFLLKLLLKQISCCAPRFPLILTAKLPSLYVKELESGILPPTPQPCPLVPLPGEVWLQLPLMQAVGTRGFWSMHAQSFE